MKRILLCALTVACLLSASTLYAQSEGKERLRWSGVETNRFWDNWEISAGFGSSTLDIATKASSKNPGKFFDRNSWNANFAVTKWFSPIVGARVQLDGGQYQNYAFNKQLFGNDLYQTPYVFVHADAMLNLSNWIGGYREDRVYYAVPYAGFGYTAMSWTKESVGGYNGEFAVTAGLLNKFRVCRQIDIQLDVRTWLFPEQGLPQQVQSGGRYAFAFSASVGVAYRFNNRGWSKAYSQKEVDGYLGEIERMKEAAAMADNTLAAANDKISDLEDANARLLEELEACRKQPKQYVVAVDQILFFAIGEATLDNYAKATLDSYIAAVKDTNTDMTITGYADRETGSAKRNEEISKLRAEAVESYIVNAGIDADRITVKWVGDTEVAFDEPHGAAVNRCVVIK